MRRAMDVPAPATSPSESPRIEAVVCVHTAARPVERAVASALANSVPLRVTVVAHNTDVDGIEARLGALVDDPRVRIIELRDGVRSPANAFNFGLDTARAEFFSLVGSDDELAPGALDAWIALADSASADVVMAPIRRMHGAGVPSPRVRWGRTVRLDGDRDRLFERTAPLGLVRMQRFGHLRFTAGLPRGVDQVYGIHLWLSGASIAFDPRLPAYVEWDDQADRVTRAPGPLADDIAYLDAIESDDVFRSASAAARRAVAAKIIRVHLLGAVAVRAQGAGLTGADRIALAAALTRLRAWAAGVDGLLARRDRRALLAAMDATATTESVRRAVGDRTRYLTLDAIVTVDPTRILHRHAPLRSMAAGMRVSRAIDRATRAHHV